MALAPCYTIDCLNGFTSLEELFVHTSKTIGTILFQVAEAPLTQIDISDKRTPCIPIEFLSAIVKCEYRFTSSSCRLNYLYLLEAWVFFYCDGILTLWFTNLHHLIFQNQPKNRELSEREQLDSELIRK